jgi:citrate lyase subunit beta/citryl-CoA lyase
VLFDGEASGLRLPACDHYAGNEKLMRKSLALQAETAVNGRAVFDITLDCEDGASAGDEVHHAELIASLLIEPENAFNHVGVRVHDLMHPARREELDIIVRYAGQRVAYITFPKVRGAAEARRCVDAVNDAAKRNGIDDAIPVHVLIETHGALEQVREIAAIPQIECLSFGLMDFVSAHRGAVPDSAMRSPGQFDHALIRRAKLEISAACHAHGKVPSHNVTTEFSDPTVARADALRACMEFGYTRMWSIHPNQIPGIVQAMQPSGEEVEMAAAILLAASDAGWGPIRFERGDVARLHDRASFRYYWDVLLRAHAAGAHIPTSAQDAFFRNHAARAGRNT